MHFNKCSLSIIRSSLKMNIRNTYFSLFFLNFVAIYSPVIVPGDNNRTIYIYREREEKLILQCYAMQGEVSPGRGFSSGALHAAKWGLEMFWGSVLNWCIYRFDL